MAPEASTVANLSPEGSQSPPPMSLELAPAWPSVDPPLASHHQQHPPVLPSSAIPRDASYYLKSDILAGTSSTPEQPASPPLGLSSSPSPLALPRSDTSGQAPPIPAAYASTTPAASPQPSPAAAEPLPTTTKAAPKATIMTLPSTTASAAVVLPPSPPSSASPPPPPPSPPASTSPSPLSPPFDGDLAMGASAGGECDIHEKEISGGSCRVVATDELRVGGDAADTNNKDLTWAGAGGADKEDGGIDRGDAQTGSVARPPPDSARSQPALALPMTPTSGSPSAHAPAIQANMPAEGGEVTSALTADGPALLSADLPITTSGSTEALSCQRCGSGQLVAAFPPIDPVPVPHTSTAVPSDAHAPLLISVPPSPPRARLPRRFAGPRSAPTPTTADTAIMETQVFELAKTRTTNGCEGPGAEAVMHASGGGASISGHRAMVARVRPHSGHRRGGSGCGALAGNPNNPASVLTSTWVTPSFHRSAAASAVHRTALRASCTAAHARAVAAALAVSTAVDSAATASGEPNHHHTHHGQLGSVEHNKAAIRDSPVHVAHTLYGRHHHRSHRPLPRRPASADPAPHRSPAASHATPMHDTLAMPVVHQSPPDAAPGVVGDVSRCSSGDTNALAAIAGVEEDLPAARTPPGQCLRSPDNASSRPRTAAAPVSRASSTSFHRALLASLASVAVSRPRSRIGHRLICTPPRAARPRSASASRDATATAAAVACAYTGVPAWLFSNRRGRATPTMLAAASVRAPRRIRPASAVTQGSRCRVFNGEGPGNSGEWEARRLPSAKSRLTKRRAEASEWDIAQVASPTTGAANTPASPSTGGATSGAAPAARLFPRAGATSAMPIPSDAPMLLNIAVPPGTLVLMPGVCASRIANPPGGPAHVITAGFALTQGSVIPELGCMLTP